METRLEQLAHRGRDGRPTGKSKSKAPGQAAVLIALTMVALIALVGLAVDGGSIYAQRRNAQNSADAAAFGATRVMLDAYQDMVQHNPNGDVDVYDESVISGTLSALAQAHGIARSSLHAYYVNDNKQLVSDTEVGYLGRIPFTLGAKGITVKDTSETNAYFMKVFGWDSVSASANATAFIGVATDVGNGPDGADGAGLFPVGFFTDTNHLNNLGAGREYTLINEDQHVPGNWGYVGFNGNNTPHIDDAWQECGYNPLIRDMTQWAQWCPGNPNPSGGGGPTGPTVYDTGWPSRSGTTRTAYSLRWGASADGWWVPGDPGKSNQQCMNLDRLAVGQSFLVPVFDYSDAQGNNAMFHMIGLAWFTITTSDVDCHASHLEIDGVFTQKYTNSASGSHGDTRHVSLVTVFMDN